MQLAQGYMLSTNYSLAEIAVLCGMADWAHLTRSFRHTFGDLAQHDISNFQLHRIDWNDGAQLAGHNASDL
jgi:transcriptional regulator GlxA family with amidase domain